jgi:predicted dehydrogenase
MVTIVGCGTIAGASASHIRNHPSLTLVAATDVDVARATAFAAAHDTRAVSSIDDLLALDADVVVNLTIPSAHEEATRAALRDGVIGDVWLVYAHADGGRNETWHPAPLDFYRVGPLADIRIYPLGLVTGMLGPVRRVNAVATTLMPVRTRLDGGQFSPDRPDRCGSTTRSSLTQLSSIRASVTTSHTSPSHSFVRTPLGSTGHECCSTSRKPLPTTLLIARRRNTQPISST